MKRACPCTERSGSNLVDEIWFVQEMINQTKYKIFKKQKLFDETQKINETKEKLCSVILCQKWDGHSKEQETKSKDE